MGTSNAYGGPGGGTPLIPSWLGAEGGAPPADQVPAAPGAPLVPPQQPPLPAPADPTRFTAPRTNFTRFATSGGSDRASLGRAVSGYVTTSAGGARRAVQRMGASRGAGSRLVGFLADVQARGSREALRTLNLEALAGRPIVEIFVGLADHICRGAGTVDEGIAREAFVETIIELATLGVNDLDALTADQMQTVFEIYATHAIEARLCNDIGTKGITVPSDAQAALRLQEQLRDFIRHGVSDALTQARAQTPNLPQNQVQAFVDDVYERSFAILQALGEAEADQ